ncbi:MAG: MogA/MoaB family molybdenum cofactor biosynthesis protein, partial [Collinsella intestinalis]|nr:MogA/MoaB family molybdenum cofactor biosynthesis protein [Collinsella intestinalis]
MDIKFAIVTCSDTRTIEQDEAGSALVGLIERAGWHVVSHVVVCDDARDISDAIRAATDELGADIVLTCGGTGLSARDVTPEATAVVCERDVPGIAEAVVKADGYGHG